MRCNIPDWVRSDIPGCSTIAYLHGIKIIKCVVELSRAC